jgi:hypothetical protein
VRTSLSSGPKASFSPWFRLRIASRIFGSHSGRLLAWISAPGAGAISAASELAVRLDSSDAAPETSADTPEKVGTAAWYSSGPLLLLPHAATRTRPATRND